jgi:acylphosphatase
MNDISRKTLRLVIYGRVQGEPDAVDTIERWAHRGPQHAQVERVEVESNDGSYATFEVIG